MQRLLRIASISEPKPDKNGRKYYTVKFHPDVRLDDGTPIFQNVAEGTRNVFGEHEGFKAEGLFIAISGGQAKKGSMVGGQIVTEVAYPYHIKDSENESRKYTAVIFDNEDATAYINKQLAPLGSCVMYGDTLTAPEQIHQVETSATPTMVERTGI